MQSMHSAELPIAKWISLCISMIVILAICMPSVGGTEAEGCSECSIYLLDLSDYTQTACNVGKNVEVNPKNGVVYLSGKGPPETAPHYFGTHSAPYFLYQAIKHSSCHTTDMESANLIFVYDYCFYISWLANVHSLGREEVETPGDSLIAGWQKMMQLPRWKQNDGADFIFYDPHPGFVSGQAEHAFYKMTCNDFKHATHILVERPQRNTCQTYHEIKKQIITPYVPNVISTEDPQAIFRRSSVPIHQRNMTVYFSGTCGPLDGNVGKQMRHDVVLMMDGDGPDIDVSCTEGTYTTFETMLSKMEQTIFCLVIAGDAQSTRRLTEIFMAGCIPVFIGPPYNSMPLAGQVDWERVGVFFNVTEYHSWMPGEEMQWSLEGPQRARWAQEAKWWIPDADISKVVIPVQKLRYVLSHLRGMPQSEISYKLKLMQTERYRFTFQEKLTDQPNAVSSIVNEICQGTSSSQNSRSSASSQEDLAVLDMEHQKRHGRKRSTHSKLLASMNADGQLGL